MTSSSAQAAPLRVAHITFGLEVGGLEKLLVETARHADPARLQLTFVSLGTEGVLGPEIERLGWPVAALNEGTGLRPGLIPRLAALFRGRKIEVVHTHNTRALVYGGPAARLARAGRLIHTWHGQNLLASPREGLLFRLASWLTDVQVAVSEDAARHLHQLGVPLSRIRIVRNGVDIARFAYTGPQCNGPMVTVARLSPEKDMATLLRAFALAQRERPHLRLEIAGDGACRGALEQLAAELGLGESVRFLGQVQDVPAVLARGSLFVLPSLTEGISLTLLEAMARGLPVVATRVGGNPEVVAAGVTGLLVSPANPAELSQGLLQLSDTPELAERMGKAGRQRVEEHFEIRGMVRGYEELYREGLRRRPLA